MNHHITSEPDYGTGKKKLGIYILGVALCVVLTLLAFWVVTVESLSRTQMFLTIFAAAIAQFFVQVVCFLRLNTQTEQGKMNVMGFVLAGVILLAVVIGSLWIMWHLNYNMIH